MRNISLILGVLFLVGLLALPAVTSAHLEDSDTMPMMDSQNTGEVTHEEFEEMEDIMLKMMNGETLTDEEWQEMSEFMESHHGSYMPMMGFMGFGQNNFPMGGQGMMWGAGSGGSFLYWIFYATTLIWLLVGILLVLYLFRKLNTR